MPAHALHHLAQRRQAAMLERHAGGVEEKLGRHAGIELRRFGAVAGLVAQPEGAADAYRGRDLGQQDRDEELPEQAAHAYSRISW
jgi:hypothetical protein